MNEFIASFIADESYAPGKLHEWLLTLNWSDVLTTNYDSLLERAASKIYQKKYAIVRTIAEIPNAIPPRIVKLHGSLSDHPPYVITEEDYRRYPVEYAPFVNLMQETLMENVFCLLGFSGSDPNFLHWAGWVRDNLGAHTPTIYLCGVLDLHDPERSLLKSLNIIPIDLSPLFPLPSSRSDNEKRHRLAMEWFLRCLADAAPKDISNWPAPPREALVLGEPSPGLPERCAAFHLDSVCISPKQTGMALREFIRSWKEERKRYPGWILAPKRNRFSLWLDTQVFVRKHMHKAKSFTPPKDLEVASELAWRIETAVATPGPEVAYFLSEVVEKYNPFPELISDLQGALQPQTKMNGSLNWHGITEQWIGTVFVLIRWYREISDRHLHNIWLCRLRQVSPSKPEWLARWYRFLSV